MGTVKYTGPVASFHCPTNAEIRSLKVHFSPKQEGTGDPSPENVRPIVGWDGVVVHNDDGNVVPEEYQKVEYLENTSSSYINTGIIAKQNIIVDAKVAIPSDATISNNGILGSRKDSSGGRMYLISCYQNAWNFGVDGDVMLSGGTVFRDIPTIVHAEVQNNTYFLKINGAVLTSGTTSFIGNDWPMYLFGANNYGNYARQMKAKVYYLSIIRDGIKVLNFIPCRRKSDNKPGMYDTVSGEFFTNQGTGEFICGPDVGETVEYEFGVLGKNKFNWNVPVSESSPVGSDAATAREFTLDTYVIGMSVNNYYRQNYANWVLNPSVENGIISFSSGSANGYGIAFPLKLAAEQTYFLSGTGNGVVGATYYNEDGELISYQNGRLNKTITIPENTATTLIGFYANTSNTDFTFSNIQLELGSTATTYEPYDPNKTVYGGWVDLVSGEVQQEWTEPLILGEPYYYGGNVCFSYTYPSKYTAYSSSMPVDRVFSAFTKSDFSINPRNYFIFGGNSTFTKTDGNGNLNPEWTNWYNSLDTKPTISLQLYEPIIYSIAPTSMQTFLAQNNVWSNADYVEVEYDLHETQTILARK